jgi:hypothetical protein
MIRVGISGANGTMGRLTIPESLLGWKACSGFEIALVENPHVTKLGGTADRPGFPREGIVRTPR